MTKRLVFHRKEIMADVTAVKTDWNATEYYAAGKATADLLTVAIGPIVVPAPTETEDNLGMDLKALPELAAGFVYGMVGDNHLTELETCYSSATPLWGFLDAALNDLEAFHIFGAIKQFESFVFHFQEDVAPCRHGEMSEDLAALSSWASIFTTPEKLVKTVTKNYLFHKKAITNKMHSTKANYYSR